MESIIQSRRIALGQAKPRGGGQLGTRVEYAGEVAAILVEHAEPVEYGQPQLIIRTWEAAPQDVSRLGEWRNLAMNPPVRPRNRSIARRGLTKASGGIPIGRRAA